MRLPAVTKHQQDNENSRAWSERLYQAFLDGQRIAVSVLPETITKVQLQVSRNTHWFWSNRGFRVRTQSAKDKATLWVWLEEVAINQQVKAPDPIEDAAWSQPSRA